MMMKRKQAGFNLVEILVSLAISGILIAGVIQLLQGNRRSDVINEQLAVMQENARLAMSFLSGEVRRAGFMGLHDPFMIE